MSDPIDSLKELAVAQLELFEHGLLPLHQLVSSLKIVQDNLSESTKNWKFDFDKHRFALEEVNALQLDEGVERNQKYEQFVADTVIKLKNLLQK